MLENPIKGSFIHSFIQEKELIFYVVPQPDVHVLYLSRNGENKKSSQSFEFFFFTFLLNSFSPCLIELLKLLSLCIGSAGKK